MRRRTAQETDLLFEGLSCVRFRCDIDAGNWMHADKLTRGRCQRQKSFRLYVQADVTDPLSVPQSHQLVQQSSPIPVTQRNVEIVGF